MQPPARSLFRFVSLPLAVLLANAQGSRPTDERVSGGLDALNKSVDACTDFYQFACGGWIAANPIPADRPRWGRFDELQEQNFVILRRILETPPPRRRSVDARRSATTTPPAWTSEAIEKGRQPLDPDLATIAALGDRDDCRSSSPISTRSAWARSSGSTRRPTCATRRVDRRRRSGRPGPARPRLLPRNRRAIDGDPQQFVGARAAGSSCWPAQSADAAPPRRAVMQSRTGWPRPRSTASRGATRRPIIR